MKKNIWFLPVIIFAVTLTSSCEKDYAKPNNLSGTEWKSETKYEGHYYLLKFPGNSSYELYEFEPSEGLDILEKGSFTIDEKILVLNSDDGITDRANIEGDKIFWDDLFGEDEIFTKQ